MAALLAGLGALAGVVLGVGWLWRTKFKRTYLFGFAALLYPAPGRLSLQLLSAVSAAPNVRAEKRAAAFRALGFVDVAAYGVNELSGAKLHVLRHPASGLVALVHEHSCVGTWSDVMRFSATDEPPVLASSVLQHVHFRCLPGDPKFHHADASEAELVRIVESSRAHTGFAQFIDAETFPRLCERAYAEAADERFRELPTENEIRRLLKDVSPDAEVSDQDVKGVRELLPELIANDWRVSCLREFTNSGGVSAREWQQARARSLVIHDHTPLRSLKRASGGAFLTVEMKKRLKRTASRTAPREEFAQLNNALPAAERYKKIGSVLKPVAADIYRAPLPGGLT